MNYFKRAFWLTLLLVATLLSQNATYKEPYRPQIHFTPAINWTNDPNGLVFSNNEWHLFYQYNPFGDQWGHMSWGHAVSADLFHWKSLEVAIPERDGVMAYSGSAVVDRNNTSGFGTNGKAPLVAIYTSRTERDQNQSLAYSNDNGRTWTNYRGNPVVDIDDPAFRDPKVFWHAPSKRWIMAVVLADRHKVRFYGSPNLTDWTQLSEFGPEGAHPVNNWECPDLFELPVEGEPGRSKWILEVDSSVGHPWLGSGCQYFVGEFDGEKFVNDNPAEMALWLDWGRDFYAAQSYSDVPQNDGRRIVIGWISNWMYARQMPTSPWRGGQSLPRELRLVRTSEGLRLTQRPVRELEELRFDNLRLKDLTIADADRALHQKGFSGGVFEIEAEIEIRDADEVGFRVLEGDREHTLVGFHANPAEAFVDRRESGKVDFNETFAGRHSARLQPEDGRVKLHFVVDRSVIELFAGDGTVAITDRVFPDPSSTGVSIYSQGGKARIVELNAYKLHSIWK